MVESHEPMGLAAEEHTCRICQLETTEDHPLFHPCKCRGSIKYIHQDCLEEWLKRSRRDCRCDICHETYKFTTIYRENIPAVAPLKVILIRTITQFVRCLRYVLFLGSVILGALQIPLFWAFATRSIEWMIYGNITHNSFLVTVLYGNFDFEGDPYSYKNISAIAIQKTWLYSSLDFLILVVCHVLFILGYDYVSTSLVFHKLVTRNIGIDVAYMNNDGGPEALNNRIRALRDELDRFNQRAQEDVVQDRPPPLPNFGDRIDGDTLEEDLWLPYLTADQEQMILERVQEMTKSSEKLEQPTESSSGIKQGEALVLTEENSLFDFNELSQLQKLNEEDLPPQNRQHSSVNDIQSLEGEDKHDVPDSYKVVKGPSDGGNEPAGSQPVEECLGVPAGTQDGASLANIALEVDQTPNIPELMAQIEVEHAPAANLPLIDEPRPADHAAAVPPPRQAQNGGVAAGATDDVSLMGFEGIIYTAVADCLIGTYLILIYLIPLYLGMSIFKLSIFIYKHITLLILKSFKAFETTHFLMKRCQLLRRLKTLMEAITSTSSNEHVISKILRTLNNVYENEASLAKVEKLIPLGIFYGLIFFGISLFLDLNTHKHDNQNPLGGTQRKIYITLFGCISTLKIFLISIIKLIVFPEFIGTILELALSPIFDSETTLILNKIHFIENYPLVGSLLRWFIGVINIVLCTAFVRGVCQRFVRPGSMFFIIERLPDKKSFGHDLMIRSMVRPLSKELPRILISGFVYSSFILIGFGVLLHGMKAFGTPLLPIELAPHSYDFRYFICVASVALYVTFNKLKVSQKYFSRYCTRALKVSSAQTRLSSYILNENIPSERGYVRYRNLSARLQSIMPDYTKPVSLEEANVLFDTTRVKACFVPDGNLVRVPAYNTVSRKFSRTLFIPVTKDDIPFQTEYQIKKQNEKRETSDLEDTDEEDRSFARDKYCIVYRPPMFGARLGVFISMLWIFLLILISSVTILANIIGKQFLLCFDFLLEYCGYSHEDDFLRLISERGLVHSMLKVDLVCVCVGLGVLTVVLDLLDGEGHFQKEISSENKGSVGDRMGRWLGLLRSGVRIAGPWLILFASNLYTGYWKTLVYQDGLKKPLMYHFSIDREAYFWHDALCIIDFGMTYLSILPTQRNIIAMVNDDDGRRDSLWEYSYRDLHRALKLFGSTHLLVLLARVFIGLHEYLYHGEHYTGCIAAVRLVLFTDESHKDITIYLWPAILVLVGFILACIRAFRYLQKINREVKDELYSIAKTLENINEDCKGES